MGKHSRPGPPNQPSRAVPHIDADEPLAAYHKRRRPPMDVWRKHQPLHGGGGHVRPDEPRALLSWTGFGYETAGTAPDLPTAQRWANEAAPDIEATDE